MQERITYEDIAIRYLEDLGWNVEKYRIFGLPWHLKIYLYPVIWGIQGEVENAIKRIINDT